MKLLIDSIAAKPIQKLYLHDNAFGPIGVAQFKDFLETTPVLTTLSVSNCGLGPEATTTIAEALIKNGNVKLEELMISRSRVENVGAHALSRYLGSYDTLQHLEIFQNGIRAEGSTALVSSLLPSARSGSLKHLAINDNFFNTDESMEGLCGLIREASSLEHLNIDSSNIEEEEHIRMLL